MRQLILIHGRAQQEKDAAGIKKEWMTAWEKGLAKSGLTNPLTDADVHFPFYGDTLAQMVAGKSAAGGGRGDRQGSARRRQPSRT